MIKTGSKLHICMGLTGFVLLSACGESAAPESEVTETVLGDIDVLEGSTSDEMITVDEFDNAQNPVASPEAASAPNNGDDAPQDAPNAEAEASEGDTVIRPRTAPPAAPPAVPAAPTGPDDADTGV
jgi:hypothetical protein